MKVRIVFAIILMAVCAFSLSAGSIRMRIDDGTVGTVVTDGSVLDVNPTSGLVTSHVGVGTVEVNSTTGISEPPYRVSGSHYAALELLSANINTSGAGVLNFYLQVSGITGPLSSMLLRLTAGGEILAPAGSSIVVESWVNPSDLVPDLGADQAVAAIGAVGALPAGSIGASPVAGGPGPFSRMSWSPAFTITEPYSIFIKATLTFTGEGSANFGVIAETVPEPANWVLMLGATAVLGLMRLRKN